MHPSRSYRLKIFLLNREALNSLKVEAEAVCKKNGNALVDLRNGSLRAPETVDWNGRGGSAN
jgi:hypothetical protein